MSAYVTDREHILALVQAALSRKFNPYGGNFAWHHNGERIELPMGDYDRAAQVAQMLWEENIRSVLSRYPNDTRETMPGPIEETFEITSQDFRAFPHDPKAVELLKSIHCYEYQSCEHEGWTKSEAHEFCRRLESAAIRALPGYEAAEWGAPRTKVHA